MISVSAVQYDPSGGLVLHSVRPENLYESIRRGSVTATLDGGVSVYDTGYSMADQTLKAKIIRPTKTTLTTLRYLVAYYGQVILSCEIGCYRAVCSFGLDKETLSLQFRLISRLDS